MIIALPTHERWFVESHDGNEWGFATSPLVLGLLAAVVAVAVACRLAALRPPAP